MLLHSDVYIWCHPWCKCIYVVFAVKIQICVVYSIAISFISTSDNINYSFHTSMNTMMYCAMVDLESHGSFGITTTFQYWCPWLYFHKPCVMQLFSWDSTLALAVSFNTVQTLSSILKASNTSLDRRWWKSNMFLLLTF